MRAMLAMVMLAVPGFVAAQEAQVPAKKTAPRYQLLQWSFVPEGQPDTAQIAVPRRSAGADLAGNPAPVCAVKLLGMPIAKDQKFTMRKIRPEKIDEGIFVKPPAPACP